MPEIISRKDARARGLKRYFTGRPCKHGHVCERYAKSESQCVECTRAAAARMRRRDPEKYRDQKRKWYANNPEKVREKSRRYRNKKSDLVAVLRAEMPELLKEFGL